MKSALVFDYDGVLVDSLPFMQKVYNEIGKRLDIPEFRNLKNPVDFFDGNYRVTLQKVGISDEKEVDMVRGIYHELLINHNTMIPLFPGIKELLYDAKDHFKLGLVSNNIKSEIEHNLEKLGVLGLFDFVAGDEYGALKPDPTQILKCAEHLEISPARMTYVGDMTNDIIAARNAKVNKMIAVTYGYHSSGLLLHENPDILVNSVSELRRAIQKRKLDA